MSKRSQQGFTLLEATASLVLLGSVAATALPKLTDLQTEANEAVLSYADSTIFVAEHIAQLKQKVEGKEPNDSLDWDEQTIEMVNSKPTAESLDLLVERKGLIYDPSEKRFRLLASEH